MRSYLGVMLCIEHVHIPEKVEISNVRGMKEDKLKSALKPIPIESVHFEDGGETAIVTPQTPRGECRINIWLIHNSIHSISVVRCGK